MANEIKYLGHSAFYIKSGNCGVLIDPWFLHNPNVKFDVNKELITHIIVTHGHSDHFGDTIKIAQAKNATVIAIFETAIYCDNFGLKTVGVGMSAEIKTDFGSVRFLPATHTNSLPNGQYGGIAASVLLNIGGETIFHAGDTGLTAEMELTGKLYAPHYAMLPIGGTFTMGVPEAVIAAKMLNAKEIIPMHYNTFDVIRANPAEFKTAIEKNGQICHVMSANDVLNF